MILEISKKTLKNIFWGVVGCIVLYWLLHETERVKVVFSVIKGVLSPFVVGGVIAFIINVPMRSFEGLLSRVKNNKLRRIIALLLTFVAVLLVLALVFWLLIPQVAQTASTFADRLPTFFGNVQTKITGFLNENPQLMEWVMQNTELESLNLSAIIEKAVDMVGNSVTAILSGAFTAIGVTASIVVNAVISIIFSLYCLFQKETLARQGRRLLYAFLPERWCDRTIRILRLTNSTFSNFLSGQCLEVCILGCLFAVTMAIFRMPYIPLVSVLVAVTAFIPVVGAFAGCVIGAFFILVDNPLQAVWFVVMFLVLQQIENNLIYPRVVGTSIGLPGMWVLLAVAVGGEFMGVAGMFLMIPLVAVLYTVIREIIHVRLDTRGIDESKLVAHPPELRSKFKEKREHVRKKRSRRNSDNEQVNTED